MSQNRVSSRAAKQTVRNLVLSLLVTCALAGAVWLVLIPHDDDADPVRPVSYSQEFTQAGRVAPYTVLAPPLGAPAGVRATSVRYTPQGEFGPQWHLGFVTAGEEYIGVEQSAENPDVFVRRVTFKADRTGTEQVAGAAWERYEGAKYDALVKRDANGVTVVTGTAPMEELKGMAEALVASPEQG
ncbi:DUF4245 domain-containing protein [Streptomyces sp. NPDC051940]|uniref:DUF4245 domain-containing protein n=1 Tax=Streptomyces sp. NPDC051940 TaxID=3155675 RepID=UPI0034385498